MPKKTVSSCSPREFLKPLLVSLMWHTKEWLDVVAEDPDIYFVIYGGGTFGPLRLSTLAESDPRAKVVYEAYCFLWKHKDNIALKRARPGTHLRQLLMHKLGIKSWRMRSVSAACEEIVKSPTLEDLDFYALVDITVSRPYDSDVKRTTVEVLID
jgi:hypothetical protein